MDSNEKEIYSDDVTLIYFNITEHQSLLTAEIYKEIQTLCILSNTLSLIGLETIFPKLSSVRRITLNMKDFQELNDKLSISVRWNI